MHTSVSNERRKEGMKELFGAVLELCWSCLAAFRELSWSCWDDCKDIRVVFSIDPRHHPHHCDGGKLNNFNLCGTSYYCSGIRLCGETTTQRKSFLEKDAVAPARFSELPPPLFRVGMRWHLKGRV